MSEAIATLLHSIGAAPAVHMRQPNRGSMNEIWLLDDDRVLRLSTEQPSRFVNERLALELAANAGLPVPRPLAHGHETGRDWLLVQQFPGTPLIDLWPDLSPARRDYLAGQAGHYLARLHDVRTGGYGLLNEQKAGDGFASWAAFLQDFLARWSVDALDCGFLTTDQLAVLERAIPPLAATAEDRGEQRLVHSDFHFENILSDGDEITALIDFEWAYGGDACQDFHIQSRIANRCEGCIDAFLDGYANTAPPLGDLAEERKWLARALLAIEQAPGLIKRGNKPYHAESIWLLDEAVRRLARF